MRQKDLLLLSVGVFLTMVAFIFISINQIQNAERINSEIEPVTINPINIDSTVFSTLGEKVE